MTAEKTVQSVDRALDIIESIATNPGGKSLTEISVDISLHKSTVHRIIATLLSRGYLQKNAQGAYQIGLKMIEAVSYYMNSLDLQTVARPYIARITAHLGLTSHLGILDKDKVVYIEKMDDVSNIRLYSQIGQHVPAHCSSLGKCLLSRYSKEQLNAVMAGCEFTKYTENTISGMEELHAEMANVRKLGWAMDNEEYEKGHRCIGAPIFDYRGDIVASISASGDKHVITDARIEEVASYVVKVAKEMSEKMGYIE